MVLGVRPKDFEYVGNLSCRAYPISPINPQGVSSASTHPATGHRTTGTTGTTGTRTTGHRTTGTRTATGSRRPHGLAVSISPT